MSAGDEVERLAAQAAARPGDPVVRARLAVATGGADGTLDGALDSARRCLALGFVEPAHEAAEILYASFPTASEVALLLADATLLRDGGRDLEQARRLFEAVVAAHPDALGARMRAAALALGLGELEAARGWVEPVASASLEARTLYVQTLLALGVVDEAAAEARTGVEVYPEASLLYQLLGIAELTQGDVEAAIQALSEGLRLGPDDPVAYYNLALAFEASGSRQAALGVTDAGLELAPDDPRLLALKARLG